MPAMVTNHSSMAGPNTAPIFAVPPRCAANSPMSTAMVMGTMSRSKAKEKSMAPTWTWIMPMSATCRPSTAESTESEGVIMPSP